MMMLDYLLLIMIQKVLNFQMIKALMIYLRIQKRKKVKKMIKNQKQVQQAVFKIKIKKTIIVLKIRKMILKIKIIIKGKKVY